MTGKIAARLVVVATTLLAAANEAGAFSPASSSSRKLRHASAFRLHAFSPLRESEEASEPSTAARICHSNDLDRRSALVGAASLALGASSLTLPVPFVPSASVASAAIPKKGSGVPTWILSNGVKAGAKVAFPVLALNTVGLSVEDTARAVGLAKKAGITHVDFHPGKERDGVAAYMKENGREGLFLNTKIRKAPPGTSPEDAAARTRAQIEEDFGVLGVKQVDMLMLRDSPDCEVIQAQWAVMEEALREGRTRSIGVINFCEKALKCLLETATVKPALNYYMLHVGMGPDPRGLRSFGESRGIKTFAYGAVGEPGPNEELLSSPVLQRIGDAHGNRRPEEVALRWILQSGAGVSVRPTTDFGLGTSTCAVGRKCEDGIAARAGALQWTLSRKEMAELDALMSTNDNPTLFSSAGCPDAFVMPK